MYHKKVQMMYLLPNEGKEVGQKGQKKFVHNGHDGEEVILQIGFFYFSVKFVILLKN
jgi:hypothetical protein